MHVGRTAVALLLGACSPVEPRVPPKRAAMPAATAQVRTVELDTPPAKPFSALEDPDRIGVGPCDEYRESYGRCIREWVPESARLPMLDALDASWRAWTEAAIGPAAGGLPIACRAALDAARQATRDFPCEYADAPFAYGPVGVDACDAYVRDYGECITTHVPARRGRALMSALVEQTKAWQDAHVSPFERDLASDCEHARAAARRATARWGCVL